MKRGGRQLSTLILASAVGLGLGLGPASASYAQARVQVLIEVPFEEDTNQGQTEAEAQAEPQVQVQAEAQAEVLGAANSPSSPLWWGEFYDPNKTPQPGENGSWVVKGRVSIDESEADKDAFARLSQSVRLWLQAQLTVPVDSRWEPPRPMVESLIRERFVETVDAPESVAADAPTMKVAGYLADFSPSSRERFLAAYQHEVAVDRLWKMGAAIMGLLITLATLSGYIRADESTKGYFTNWLRGAALTTAGAGAGAVYYFFFA